MDVSGLVQMMREEVGVERLDLRYNTRAPRFSEVGDGCWEVVMSVPTFSVVEAEGHRIAHSREQVRVIYRLNGNYDRPLTPGRWLITALCERDKTRHGRKTIEQSINARLEGVERHKHVSADKLASDFAKNADIRRGLKRVGEQRGSALDRGDVLALEKAAAADRQLLEDERLAARKDARLYGNV